MAKYQNGESIKDVVVVGAGEVFQRCYLAGNAHLPPDRRLRFAHIIDALPEEQLRTILSPKFAEYKSKFWQLGHKFKVSLRNLLKKPELHNLPFLLAVPTPCHIPYAEIILEEGNFVAIEKPLASSLLDVRKFENILLRHGTDRIFLFAYYLLEKGLPLMVWAREGQVDPFVSNLVTFRSSYTSWKEARQTLGKVLKIYGVILEGIGLAGRLDQRLWTLDSVNGGNTVETFYHLMCLIDPLIDHEGGLLIRDVCLATHGETALKLAERGVGPNIAETLTWVRMKSACGTEIELIAAKYVPPRIHQRWVHIICERGLVRMDLEAQQLDITENGHFLSSTLRWPQKYATQFMLLTEKLRKPNMPIEDNLLLRALQQTLMIREKGMTKEIQLYSGEDVCTTYMSQDLRNLVEIHNHERH